METGLIPLVLYQQAPFVSELVQDFGEEILEVLEGAVRPGSVVADEFAVTDVESRSVDVRAFGGGIAVDPPQLAHSHIGAKQTCHFQAVSAPAAAVERIGESLPYLFEQVARMLPQIRV